MHGAMYAYIQDTKVYLDRFAQPHLVAEDAALLALIVLEHPLDPCFINLAR